MDNKLQGFIKSMQDSATPLSDSAPLSENGELSDASSYYSIMSVDEDAFDDNNTMKVEKCFEVSVNYDKIVNDLGIQKGDPCFIRFKGKSRGIRNASYSIFSYESNKFIGAYSTYDNNFDVRLDKIYAVTGGSVNFKFVSFWDAEESVTFDYTSIHAGESKYAYKFIGTEINPTQSSFKFYEGQYFYGYLNMVAFYENADAVSVASYKVTPDRALRSGDYEVEIKYITDTYIIPITVVGLNSIRVTKNPNKIRYFKGEQFDPTGLEIFAYYQDGSSHKLSNAGWDFLYSYDKVGQLSTSDTQIIFSFMDKTCVLPIQVIEKKVRYLRIQKQPNKTEYKEGEKFNSAGMEVIAIYNDDSYKEVGAFSYMCSPSRELLRYDESVTISYDGASVVQPISVKIDYKNKEVITETVSLTEEEKQYYSFSIEEDDKKRIVINGEFQLFELLESIYINKDRMFQCKLRLPSRAKTLPANYNIYSLGDGELIYTGEPEENCIVVDLIRVFKLTGNTRFKIANGDGYGSLSFFMDKISLEVEVEAPESINVLIEPKKTFYIPGEKFDKTGLVIEAGYSDGTVDTITRTDLVSVNPANNLTTSDKTVTVFFRGKSTNLNIEFLSDDWGDFKGRSYKELALNDKVKGLINLHNAGFITGFNSFESDNFVIPMNISHYYRTEIFYAQKWYSSLDRTLKLSESDDADTTVYTYTDEMGDTYEFDEKYYYIENGQRIFVDKSTVSIDLSGNITYGGKPVYKHQSCNGYTLIPETDDFKGCEYIEQRQKEQIELEEYINSYEASLKNCIVASCETGEKVGEVKISDKEAFLKSLEGISEKSEKIVISESEALQLKSLILQNLQLDRQNKQTNQQIKDLINTKNLSYLVEGENCKKTIDFRFLNDKGEPLGNNDDSEKEKIIRKINYQMSYQSAVGNMSLLENQMKDSSQKVLLEDQIEFIIKQARKNLQAVKDVFDKYVAKKEQLKLLLQQTPVNFIIDKNGIISGFNAEGYFVCIFDAYNNYVAIERNAENLVTGVYDSKKKVLQFSYDGDLLNSITDERGRRVKYGYENKNISNVEFADGSTVDFGYEYSNITSVERCKNICAKIKYGGWTAEEVKILSVPLTIGKNTVKQSSDYTETLFTVSISKDFSSYSTIHFINLSYDDGNAEIHKFSPNRRTLSYTEINNIGRENVTYYDYTVNSTGGKVLKTIKTSDVDEKTSCTETYNDIDQLTVSQTDWQRISDTVRVKQSAEYKYDENNNLVTEISKVQFENNGALTEKTSCTNYFYNAQGKQTLKESYIECEELISGKTYQEYVYDENGNVIKTISWNSLDSSSKFYSEADRAENGQIIAEKDETGENSAEYEYLDGTNVVNSVKYANGSKLAYGRNPFNYEVTSVTQSTESGESNSTEIVYSHGLPVEVKSGNTVINYEYDCKRRKTAAYLNGELYESYEYTKDAENGNQTVTVSNRAADIYDVGTTTDKQGNVINIAFGGLILLVNAYDERGRLTNSVDKLSQKTGTYAYDSYDRLTEYTCGEDTEAYTYNGLGELTQKVISGAVDQTYTYTYKDTAARELDYITVGGLKYKPLTDVNGRNTGREIYYNTNKIAGEYITYRKVGDHATNMPSAVWYAMRTTIKHSLKYTYDKSGNITEIKENGALALRYSYDSLNRLIREDNKKLNKTYLFEYDGTGNIISKRQTAFTLKRNIEECEFEVYTYAYNGDKLVNYNGESCTYNEIGNPTKYRDKKAEWWFCGKLLSKYNDISMTYDSLSKRLSKGEITYTYDREGRLIKQSNGLEFIYDNSGLAGVKYNTTIYFYRKDAQGNIIALLDRYGRAMVNYVYDAWGNHKVVNASGVEITDANHIGNLNPFRYRSYYYDTEFKLYYLQTRYYDPEVGRFISQDGIEYADPETINGLNLYAYCGNNPIMNVDPTGHSFLVFLLAALIGFGISFASSAASQAVFNGGKINWKTAAIDGVFGAISGALWMVPGLGAVATGLINAGLSALNGTITTGIENNWQFNLVDVLSIISTSVVSGIVSGKTRNVFLSDKGKEILNKTHKLVGTIGKRIVTGYYNNGVNIFSKSFISAAKQMFGALINLNFSKGFIKDWLITGLQTIFSITFSKGINGIRW